MMLSCGVSTSSYRVPHVVTFCYNNPNHPTAKHGELESVVTRRALSLLATSMATATTAMFSVPILFCDSSARRSEASASASATSTSTSTATGTQFSELPQSGGVKALDLRIGDGDSPVNGDKVAIHYYGRLAAKQGWRFDSTYDHKDETGEPVPFSFILGSGKVIQGMEEAVRSMKVGGIRRVIIPPSQGYQNMSQEPIPPNFFDRQRLFTTIFNPTRLANGEGSTLGILIFDIELVSLNHL
ncbi:peptidyl-prolyl cis-trans isomerase FKBP17-1, chloroplastic [Cynara cardunculus var. scolymus]|uniref:peptidyl-prolyl cis-trans isomerase FKBP17-1, chloroplastic n=1 Tax=Cynara cardunculus var. scolymus TaxID=59895 RepID=UPI000D6269D3|nr:peptidyl-prolyl cis-trans isomerase FKBP17-1, chloroplastic [Cynara cardunculus var. scolymus]